MVLIPYHSSLSILQCRHKDDEEEDSRGTDEDDGNNNIISKEFDEIRHNKT